MSTRIPAATSNATYPDAPAALAQLRATLEALPPSYAVPLRANVPTAVRNLLVIDASFATDRARLEAAFTPAALPTEAVADLRTRTLALWQADVDLRVVLGTNVDAAAIAAEAAPVRAKLLAAADYLFGDDAELGPRIGRIRGGGGYVDLADDLAALSTLLEGRWAQVQSRSQVEASDLADARRLAEALVAAVKVAPAKAAQALRDRAGAWAFEAAAEIRAVAAWLHRGDPEHMARAYPSPYAILKPRRRPSAGAQGTPQPEAEASPAEA